MGLSNYFNHPPFLLQKLFPHPLLPYCYPEPFSFQEERDGKDRSRDDDSRDRRRADELVLLR